MLYKQDINFEHELFRKDSFLNNFLIQSVYSTYIVQLNHTLIHSKIRKNETS